MDLNHQDASESNSRRSWMTLAIYAGAGWVTTGVLMAARAEAGLPEMLDTVFLTIFIAGFPATLMLIKAGVTGGVPPILQALRAVAVVLAVAGMVLLFAHWSELGSPSVHAREAASASVPGDDTSCLEQAGDLHACIRGPE